MKDLETINENEILEYVYFGLLEKLTREYKFLTLNPLGNTHVTMTKKKIEKYEKQLKEITDECIRIENETN